MRIGFAGLGKMGGSMARRLSRAGHAVVAYNRTVEVAQTLADEEERISPAMSLEALVERLSAPRAVWVMVPAGEATEAVITQLADLLDAGDAIIDGGNSNHRDTLRRNEALHEASLHLIDVGTSGGVWGLTEGYCLMVGGDEKIVERLRPVFEALAPGPSIGWGRVGPTGSGHFAKMVHNGIEYGAMQAYAEGFEILKEKPEYALDLHQVAEIWRHGSVIRSWLLDLISDALDGNQNLEGIAPWVADSGEGRWTVFEAIEQDVPAPVITLSLLMRLASRQDGSYAAKLLAALRQEFGGHDVKSS
ncbi:phosphogluconate dehydrogenase (NAD(+)-dependent, decarboxylating) [Candidatus Bipolaricaulota bacterium]